MYTLAEAKATLKVRGMTIKKTEDGEYRVNTKGGPERTAYYTTCLQDAVNSGLNFADEQMCPKNP